MAVERQLSGYRTWKILHLGNVLALFSKSGNECNWDSNPKIRVKFQNWKKMNVHVINWSERKNKNDRNTLCYVSDDTCTSCSSHYHHRHLNSCWKFGLSTVAAAIALGQIRKKCNVKKHSEMQWESIAQPYANCIFSPFLPCSSQLSILLMFNQPWNINK